MTVPSRYHETARRVLAGQASGSDTHAEQIAAAERVLRRLQEYLVRWFGPDGFHAVLSRALATARANHPALTHVSIEPRREARLTELAASAHAYRPAELSDAVLALIAATLALLSRLIGDDMVRRLLEEALADEAPNEIQSGGRPEDTRMTKRE